MRKTCANASLACLAQELCVMEAMKMQNVLRAEKDGVVKRVVAKVRVCVCVCVCRVRIT